MNTKPTLIALVAAALALPAAAQTGVWHKANEADLARTHRGNALDVVGTFGGFYPGSPRPYVEVISEGPRFRCFFSQDLGKPFMPFTPGQRVTMHGYVLQMNQSQHVMVLADNCIIKAMP